MNEAIIQIKDTNTENGLEKTTNLRFIVILAATLHKESWEIITEKKTTLQAFRNQESYGGKWKINKFSMNNSELIELIYAGAILVYDKIGTRTEIENLEGKFNRK